MKNQRKQRKQASCQRQWQWADSTLLNAKREVHSNFLNQPATESSLPAIYILESDSDNEHSSDEERISKLIESQHEILKITKFSKDVTVDFDVPNPKQKVSKYFSAEAVDALEAYILDLLKKSA